MNNLTVYLNNIDPLNGGRILLLVEFYHGAVEFYHHFWLNIGILGIFLSQKLKNMKYNYVPKKKSNILTGRVSNLR